MRPHRNQLIALFGSLWIFAIGWGIWKITAYENKPALAPKPPLTWPAASHLRHGSNFTLVMAIHPQCSCTRASIDELAVLLTRCADLSASLVFLQPAGFSQSWVKSDIWQRVQSMPGVSAVIDPDGKESRLFNTLTSGEVALYNPLGRLIFYGGITGSRGHVGDNAGVDAIVALVRNQKVNLSQTPVFGCSLVNGECTQGSGNAKDRTGTSQ